MEGYKKSFGNGATFWSKKNDSSNASTGLASTVSEVNALRYAESHAGEIQALQKAVRVQQGGHAITQKLPPHMRRRALSHNIKRLPKALRAAAVHLFANQKGLIRKRPSRFFRRRPKNLMQEYARRQRKHMWLETHIWHAKRFHMVEKWGHKLPWKPTQKSERAAYRATTKHCLLQDMSYMCCIELNGPEDTLLKGLTHISNKATGQTFAAISCRSGTREGHMVMYKYDKYPLGAIGPVTFLWQPVAMETRDAGKPESKPRRIWLWCHPACFHEVWDNLVMCFSLAESSVSPMISGSCTVQPDNLTKPVSKKDSDIQYVELLGNSVVNHSKVLDDEAGEDMEVTAATKKGRKRHCMENSTDDQKNFKKKKMENSLIEEGATVCESHKHAQDKFKAGITIANEALGVTIQSLSGSLMRFRLTGPQSNAVLYDALQQADVVPSREPGQPEPWWDSYYAVAHRSLAHSAQREVMEGVKECQSPAELPPCAVIGLLVRDPRLNRPTTRTKIVAEETDISDNKSVCKQKITPDVSASPLWDAEVREQVTATKMSDYKIHELRSERLVPGLPLELGNEESRVPVILIQRPGASYSPNCGSNPSATLGRGSGWDILLPKSWSMALWLSLVFRGARCGGLRELENCAHEERTLLFPNDYPDTMAGCLHQLEQEREFVEKYNRRPPAKRTNYTKYGVAAPFTCPWSQLLGIKDAGDEAGSGGDGSTIGAGHIRQNVHDEKGSDKSLVKVDTNSSSVKEKCHIASDKQESEDKDVSKMECDNLQTQPISSYTPSIPVIKFHVLRDIKLLQRLENILCSFARISNQLQKSPLKADKMFEEVLTALTSLKDSAIIPVRLELLQRGAPKMFSAICLPNDLDLESLRMDKNYGGPEEPKHIDPVEEKKKQLKKELKAKMGRSGKKKVKVDRTLKMLSGKGEIDVDICSRKTIGYLVSGGYSLGIGGGSGVGYVTADGLSQLLRRLDGTRKESVRSSLKELKMGPFMGIGDNLVLVRGQSTCLYRFAKLSIAV